MTPVLDGLPVDVNFDVVDALRLIPSRTRDSRVELDVWIEVILLREVFEVLPSLSTNGFDPDSKNNCSPP